MRNIILVVCAALVGSCASTYIPPTSGKVATIIVPNKSSSYSLLGGASSAGVQFAIKGESGCGKVFKHTAPKNPEDKNVEIVIPANREIFVKSYYSMGNSFCNVAGSFLAEENTKYMVVNSGGYGCGVGVVKVGEKGSMSKVKLSRAKIDIVMGTKICAMD